MILLSEYLKAINGTNHTPALKPAEVELNGAYVCDMLSDVMGSAKPGQAWITIMKHLNVIAVASMTGIPAIVFAKGNIPDAAVIDKATEENVLLISSPLSTFELAGKLYQMLQG
jgi:serine kinase of HPr protein (carbohydrate metabolism regulator)